MDTALDGIVTIDSSGTVTEVNPAAEEIFAWPRAELIGRPLAETLIPAQDRERHRVGLQRAVAGRPGTLLGRRVEV
jgi:PAS domain S-box-containing protein